MVTPQQRRIIEFRKFKAKIMTKENRLAKEASIRSEGCRKITEWN